MTLSKKAIVFFFLVLVSAFVVSCDGGGGSGGSKNNGGDEDPVESITNNDPVYLGNIDDRTLTVGVEINVIVGNFVDSDGDTLNFSINGSLPSGLTLNQTSGEITGTPLIAGVTNGISIVADDSRGGITASNVFSIEVVEPGKMILTVNDPSQFPQNPELTSRLATFMQENLKVAIEPVNRIIALPTDLIVTVDNCGLSNAFYSLTNRTITMCWELFFDSGDKFFEEIVSGTGTPEEESATTFRLTIDSYIFVLYHELAHALDDQLNLPIAGNPESAADGIAAVLSIEQFQAFGSAYPLTAGILLTLSGGSSFAGVHPGNEDRAGDLICLAIGGDERLASNPGLAPLVQIYADAGRDCTTEYAGRKSAVEFWLPNLANLETQIASSRSKSTVENKFGNDAVLSAIARLASNPAVREILMGSEVEAE